MKIERENISEELASIFFDSGYYNEVTLGNSSDLVGGEQVIAVGNPLITSEKTEHVPKFPWSLISVKYCRKSTAFLGVTLGS